MRALYDGKRERVRGSENAFLTWSGDDEFDAEAAHVVRRGVVSPSYSYISQ